jgi:replicative DNA helicase
VTPPPQNLEAERSVLGSMLRDNGCIAEVAALLRAEDFAADGHRKVFAAILGLWHDHRKPADLHTLPEELRRLGHLEDAGHADGLFKLWEAAPSTANVLYHAGIVRDRSLRRALIGVATAILRSAQGPDGQGPQAPACDLIEEAEQNIFALSEHGVRGAAFPIGEAIDPCLERIQARIQGSAQGLPAGFLDLDSLTGGFQDGELILIGARPSAGKTAILDNLAVRGNLPAFFASIEQSRLEVVERLLCLEGRVDSLAVRRGKILPGDRDRLMDAAEALRPAPLYLDDSSGQGVLDIAANARRLKAARGIKAVCIDYLGLIEPEDRRAPRCEQVGNISRRLKLMARELSLPVICLAQLNREVESRKDERPKLSDLRETGELEQNADVVILLHRPKNSLSTLDLIVAKQRNGPTGELTLTFQREFYRFDNHAPGLPP